MKNVKLRVEDIIKGDVEKGITRNDPEVILENNHNSGDTIFIYNDSMNKNTGAITFIQIFQK